jgi:hypothetical protein
VTRVEEAGRISGSTPASAVGLAVSDPLGLIAQGSHLRSPRRRNLFARLRELVEVITG